MLYSNGEGFRVSGLVLLYRDGKGFRVHGLGV
jgi:hypothetical protein